MHLFTSLGLFAGGVLLYSASPLPGQQPQEEKAAIVQELFASEMVYPQERDELQVRMFTTVEGADGLGALSVEYGLTDSLQMEVATGFGFGNEGVEGGEFGLQWSLLDLADTGIHIAVGLENEFRDGASFAEQRSYAVVAKEYDGPLGNSYLFGNLGFGLHERVEGGHPDEDDSDERWDASAGFVHGVSRTMRLTQEFSWAEHEGADAAGRQLRWVPGIVWLLPTGGELGLGVSLPIRGGKPLWALSFVHEFDEILGRQ